MIESILEADTRVLKKQRHTAQRLYERLRDEYGYTGGYTVVREYVARERLKQKEVFIPLAHPPGHAQCDFGQADAYIAGVKQRVHYFCLYLPHSDAIFVKAYPAETTEAFLDGHVAAFAWLGGVPLSVLYDNTTLAVATANGCGRRPFTNCTAIICSPIGLDGRVRATTKAKSKNWWATPGVTASCPCLESAALMS